MFHLSDLKINKNKRCIHIKKTLDLKTRSKNDLKCNSKR